MTEAHAIGLLTSEPVPAKRGRAFILARAIVVSRSIYSASDSVTTCQTFALLPVKRSTRLADRSSASIWGRVSLLLRCIVEFLLFINHAHIRFLLICHLALHSIRSILSELVV